MYIALSTTATPVSLTLTFALARHWRQNNPTTMHHPTQPTSSISVKVIL